jgi:hypothetical protein
MRCAQGIDRLRPWSPVNHVAVTGQMHAPASWLQGLLLLNSSAAHCRGIGVIGVMLLLAVWLWLCSVVVSWGAFLCAWSPLLLVVPLAVTPPGRYGLIVLWLSL